MNILRTASGKLGSVPSMLYFLMYLLAIPLFAVCYLYTSDQFYHGALLHDPRFKSVLHKAERLLEAGVERKIAEISVVDSGHYNAEWQITNYSKASRADDQEFALEMYFVVRRTDPESESTDHYSGKLTFSPVVESPWEKWGWREESLAEAGVENEMPVMSLPGWERNVTFFVNGIESFPQGARAAFPFMMRLRPEERETDYHKMMTLELSEEAEDLFIDLADSAIGVSQPHLSEFWRYFYFSAITITTLGYGDIVPVTTTSRLLVSVESILGISLFGLFLNSLAREGGA